MKRSRGEKRADIARATADVDATEDVDADADADAEELAGEIEIPAEAKHVTVVDNFLPADLASVLRGVYDARHDDPRRVHAHRFVWDYWHVPQQYTLLRTPAADYFEDDDQYARLEDALRSYARTELGCGGLTPVWLSCYVDGCRQELHADVPHGPWAFVLSLTRWDARLFTGGETLVLNPETLEYWRTFRSDDVVERASLTTTIEPLFNRLTVFDPRVPHGVPVVEGVRDPKLGRLVLHGWFNDPEPFFDGALSETDAEETLLDVLPPLYETLGTLPRARGVVAAKVLVNGDGGVERVQFTADSLVPSPEGVGGELSATYIRDAIMLEIAGTLMETTFPASDGETRITLPFVFD